jgi:hypothetical protein
MRDVAQTSTRDGITTVSVNSEIGSLAALQAASMGSAAGTAAHEGTHIDDERNRLGGRDPRTRQEWYDTERRAFRLQGQVDRALGAASRGGYPLWLPSWGRGVEERNMEAGAHDNAWMTACGSGCESVNPW